MHDWRRSLAASGRPDTLLVADPQAASSWLDLTHAHPNGLAQLFAGRLTRLSSLFRESGAHTAAWRQARAIRSDAQALSAQRGVQGCCLAIGVASWRARVSEGTGPMQAPIVLRGCAIRPRRDDDDDFDLDLDDAVLVNPELIRVLAETYGIAAEIGGLSALAHGEKGFDPRPVYAWLEEHGDPLHSFKIERTLALAVFAAGSGAVLADLDAAVPSIAAHGLLSRVAQASGPELLSLPDSESSAILTPRGDLEIRHHPDPVEARPSPPSLLVGSSRPGDRAVTADSDVEEASPSPDSGAATPVPAPQSSPSPARPTASFPGRIVPRAIAPRSAGRLRSGAAGRAARASTGTPLTPTGGPDGSEAPVLATPSVAAGASAGDTSAGEAPARVGPAVGAHPGGAPAVDAQTEGARAAGTHVQGAPAGGAQIVGGLAAGQDDDAAALDLRHFDADDSSSGPSVTALEVSSPPQRPGELTSGVATEAGPPAQLRRLAVVGRLGPRGARPIAPPVEPDPATELLVLDCDPAQQHVVAAALRGENVVIEGPPGSGATQALAACVAGLVAAGRKVLVVSPRRPSTEALLARLHQAGLGDLVLDVRDSDNAGGPVTADSRGPVAALRSAVEGATAGRHSVVLPRPGLAQDNEEIVATIRTSRDLLDGSVRALHDVRAPWGVSAYDAMVSLAEITGRPDSPSGQVRLPDAVLATLDAVTRERLRVHLHSAASAGAFTLTRVDTRWYDAVVSAPEQARAALEAALILRAGLDQARAAMAAVTQAAGLPPAVSAADWVPALDLLLGVRAVVDVLVPQTYHQPLDQLTAAIVPRGLRNQPVPGAGPDTPAAPHPSAHAGPRPERRRLRRQAQGLIRPGVHVPNLYDVLVTAAQQQRQWARLSRDGGGPRVVVGLTEAQAAVHRVSAALAVLSQVFAGSPTPDLTRMPLDDLEQRVFDLAGDPQGILGQPRRARLLADLARAGLGELAADLRARRVGPDQIDSELDLLWWASIRDSIVRSDPRLARHDSRILRRASEDLCRAEDARIAAGAELVRAAVLGRADRVLAARADQVRLLRNELARDDNRFQLVDLVRRTGDVLAAITPIWVMSPDTVAAALAPADPSRPPIVDTVVLDDAGQVGLPEVAAAMARGAQVIVAGDRRRLSPPDGGVSVVEALWPFARVCRLERDHRTVDGRLLVPLAPRYPEGWQLTPGTSPAGPLQLEAVPDGVAIPPPGEELPVSSDAEVLRVVELVELHALRRPEESLAVITLSERHAERIEAALRLESADRPLLGRWLAERWPDGRPESFVVRPVQRALGIERDAAIVSIGLARTPHGRLLHRFGVLDGGQGAAVLTTAVSRARRRTTVVCCFTAEDLIVDRLRTAGARLLRDVLLAAGGRVTTAAGRSSSVADGLVTELRDRLAGAGLPVRLRVGDGGWPLDLAVADPRVPGRMLVAVDLDSPAFSCRPCGERERNRPSRWQRAGWRYHKVSSMDFFRDPALEVSRIKAVWEQAMAFPPSADDSAWPPNPLALTSGAMSGPEDDDSEPVIPDRAPDDSDEGWNEREQDNRDEQIRRERPPHWD